MKQTGNVYIFSKSKTQKDLANPIRPFQMDRKFCIQMVVLQSMSSWMMNTANTNNTLKTLVWFGNPTIQWIIQWIIKKDNTVLVTHQETKEAVFFQILCAKNILDIFFKIILKTHFKMNLQLQWLSCSKMELTIKHFKAALGCQFPINDLCAITLLTFPHT